MYISPLNTRAYTQGQLHGLCLFSESVSNLCVCLHPGADPAIASTKRPSLTPVSQGLHSVSGQVSLRRWAWHWETGFHCPVLNARFVPFRPWNQAEKDSDEAYLEVSSPRRLGNKNTNSAMETVHGVNTALLAAIQKWMHPPPALHHPQLSGSLCSSRCTLLFLSACDFMSFSSGLVKKRKHLGLSPKVQE